MSLRTVLVVALALVFGVSAALGVNLVTRNTEETPPPEAAPPASPSAPETVKIVVAAQDIPRHMPVSPSQVRLEEFPKDLVPAGALSRIEDAIERLTLSPVVKHQVLLINHLSRKGASRSEANAIPKGMRAHTIQTAKVSGAVSGILLPGDKVDVLLTMNRPSSGAATTFTLLTKVDVWAVDKRLEAAPDPRSDPKELRSVTLLVTPDQAAKLTLGESQGV